MSHVRVRGVIKAIPESFVVQELLGPGALPVPLHQATNIKGYSGSAPITLFHMVKRDMTTHAAVHEVRRQLGAQHGSVTHYGLKDRRAVTSQCIGVRGPFRSSFSHDRITLCQAGSAQRAPQPGKHAGNRFSIEVLTSLSNLEPSVLGAYRNLFGDQRFRSPQGHIVGRLLLEGSFASAMALERTMLRYGQEDPFRRYEDRPDRAFFSEEYRFETSFRIQQWQSHLWNQLALRGKDPDAWQPMWTPDARDSYKALWDPPQIDPRAAELLHDFSRKITARPTNVSVARIMGGWRVGFDLPPGAYATVALSQVFSITERASYEARKRA